MCLMCLPASLQQIVLPCRAKRLSLKKRTRQAGASIVPPTIEAAGAHVLDNGLGGTFTAPRQACLKGMPWQQKPLLNGRPQASSADALAQPLSILSSKQAELHAAARMDDGVRPAAGMSGTIDGSVGPTARLSEQPLGITSSEKAEPEAPARPGVPVDTARGTCGSNGASAEPAAGQSGLSMGSRQSLQGWVPRKRNLASFDALDDLPDLSSLVQQRAAQKPHASMPFKAHMCPPGLQKPPQTNSTSDSLSAVPAGFTKQITTLEGTASICTDVAAPAEASQPAGSTAPSRMPQYRKPFAAPRPLQKPRHRASADAGGQAVSTDPILRPLGKPSVSGELRAASGALASPAGLGPLPGCICNELDGRQSKGSAPQAQSACRADSLSAGKPRTDCLPVVEHSPPVSRDADLKLMDGACSSNPLQTSPKMHRSRSASKQQQQQGSMAGIVDSQPGSRARQYKVRSGATEDTTPVCAAGADWAAQRRGRAQSAGRKQLKRLYGDTLADSASSDGPRHGLQVCASASLCLLPFIIGLLRKACL